MVISCLENNIEIVKILRISSLLLEFCILIVAYNLSKAQGMNVTYVNYFFGVFVQFWNEPKIQ